MTKRFFSSQSGRGYNNPSPRRLASPGLGILEISIHCSLRIDFIAWNACSRVGNSTSATLTKYGVRLLSPTYSPENELMGGADGSNSKDESKLNATFCPGFIYCGVGLWPASNNSSAFFSA